MSHQSKTILIVDDDESIRESMKLALESEGYSVQTAANGQEGLELLRRIQRPFLILLDLMMPVMDGWGFAHALHSDPHLAKPPIAVFTAFAERAKNFRGAALILSKPIDLDSLFSVVRKFFLADQELTDRKRA